MSQDAPSNATIGPSMATIAISSTLPSVQAMNLSTDLDGFFENLTSALDVLAQVINLVYFDPPKRGDEITFYNLVDELREDVGKQNEPITLHLSRTRQSRWYKGMKAFRKRAFHDRSIEFRIQTKPSSFEPLREYFPCHEVKAILLPDNPRSNQPIYKRRSVQTYCVRMLKWVLDSIDIAYALMDNKIRAANRVPV